MHQKRESLLDADYREISFSGERAHASGLASSFSVSAGSLDEDRRRTRGRLGVLCVDPVVSSASVACVSRVYLFPRAVPGG